jgi:hypothetical protein
VRYARIGDAGIFQKTTSRGFFIDELFAEFNDEFAFEINIELSAELSPEFSTWINTKFADEINAAFAGKLSHRRLIDLLDPGAGQSRTAALCPG